MIDVRRIIVIFVIAILFTLFVNVAIEAFYPQPEYDAYCTPERVPKPVLYEEPRNCTVLNVPQELTDQCIPEKGSVEYQYDSRGCPKEAYCNTCYRDLDRANERYNLFVFIVSAITGLGALIAGLYLPQKSNPINEWVGSGFLLGGLFTIAVGTMRYFGDMGRYMRPVVIFIELALVIYLAYKKLGKK